MSTEAQLPGSARRLVRPMPPTGTADANSTTATMAWFVPYADLAAFLDVVDGLPETVVVMGASVTRNIPLQHPWFGGLYASGYRYQAGGWEDGHEFGFHVEVQFEAPQYSITGGEPYVRISGRPAGRTMFVPQSAAVFNDNTTTGNDPSLYIPGNAFGVTVYDSNGVSAPIEAAWAAAAYSVNIAYWRSFPPRKLLYQGTQYEYIIKRNGTITCTYTHSFESSVIEWNQQFRRDGVPDTVLIDGVKFYPEIDFSVLFV